MKPMVVVLGLLVGAGMGLGGCDSAPPSADAGKGPATMGDMALVAPPGSEGRTENDEGVALYREKHWNEAEQHFRHAVDADANLVEAHYNLGLALDKLGDHDAAAVSFKKVAELAPKNSPMRSSVILKEHVGM